MMKGKVKAKVRTGGATGLQKGNLKTLVRLYGAGTTKCSNKSQDSVHQQRPSLFLEYINCLSLLPQTFEKERYVSCKEKTHGKVLRQWNSSFGAFSLFCFFFNFALPLPLCPGVGDCSRVGACTAWREYPLLHHTAAYKDSLLLQNKSNVWGETQEVPLYYHDLGMLLWFSNGWSQQSAACCYQLKESFFDTRFSFLKTLSFILPDALSIFLSVCLCGWLDEVWLCRGIHSC